MRRVLIVLLVAGGMLSVGCRAIVPPASSAEFTVACDLATAALAEGLINAYEDVQPGALLSLSPSSRLTALANVTNGTAAAALILYPPAEPVFHTPIARDGIVFVAGPGVPVENVTQRDARALLAGRIAAWPVPPGEPALPIVVVVDGQDESTRLALSAFLMREQAFAPAARIASDPNQLLRLVADTPGAVSYVPYSALTVGTVKHLAFEGLPPTPESIQSNRYALITTIDFVSASDPSGDVRGFLEWILSPVGQQVVERYAFSLNN